MTDVARRVALGAGLAAAVGAGALAASQALGASPETTAIVGGTVFDATGAAPHPATVLIRDGRIADVGPKVKIPRGAKVIHADGEALLPGFFDVHTHWTPGGVPATTPQIANAYISSGVTTVDDFNAAPESFEPRRRWVAQLASPHVRYVARISTPGGHGADWADQATTRWANTPEAARAAIRSLIPYKPDAIKAFTDGWRYGTAPDNTSMDPWTISALTDEAHKNGWKVLTHTVTVDRGQVAAENGVDIIAHSLQDRPIDDATVALIKAKGTANSPTLAVYEPVKPGMAPPKDMNDPKVKQSFEKFGYALNNVKKLYDAGVLIVLGTDAGMPNTPHGPSSLHEMELLVRAGLTPAQALTVGTANSAKGLNLLADRGTIEKGKRADLVLIKGRPWVNIADVHNTDRTFVDGRLVYGPGVRLPALNETTALPSTPAQARIDDFERADGRSSLDTLRTTDPDGGLERSVEVIQVIDRGDGGHALSMTGKMSIKAHPEISTIIPLSRGSIQPVDARRFKGVRFDIRGDGDYALELNGVTGRWSAPVGGLAAWKTVEVPFSALKAMGGRGEKAAFTGGDLQEVEFLASRAAGQAAWLEIDNVSFY
jgi:imidazolonepropionase-like amidohydrolase